GGVLGPEGEGQHGAVALWACDAEPVAGPDRDGTVLTFAHRTEHSAGDNDATIEVIELDCAAARYRRTSAAATRRNREMTASNAPGALETYPEGSVMAQIAGTLCEGVSGR